MEDQYLNLVRDILETGTKKEDRTGVGTLSKFGCQMRFNLENDCFPLLTTKRIFYRGVIEELLWFISGKTNAKILQEKNVHIWDSHSSKEYLKKFNREEGDLGPIYGFQWRHYGEKYIDMNSNYAGVDQLKLLIEKIKTNPNDRRLILTSWNPCDIELMALPPCHMFAQFYVNKNELSCQFYQRSCDMGLGVPFNIASYSLLTHMIAKVCGLTAKELIYCMGDTHIYLNHIEALKFQLTRKPKPFPTIKINNVSDIDSFKITDFEVLNYNPDTKIDMQIAV